LPPSSGDAKSPKGRTRLVQHAVRQRRLLKRRQKAALLKAAAVDKKEGSL
jgi:hypothetical protein